MTCTDQGQGFWFPHFIGLNPLIVPLIARAGTHRLHSAVLALEHENHTVSILFLNCAAGASFRFGLNYDLSWPTLHFLPKH